MGMLCNRETCNDTVENYLFFDCASPGITFPDEANDSSNIGNRVADGIAEMSHVSSSGQNSDFE